MKRRHFSIALASAVCPALPALAQDAYPSRPIRMLVPSAPGGGIDLLGRMFAQAMAEQLGQQVVIENMGGGGGTIASATVARAPADGYTLIFQATTAAVNAAALSNLPFDPVKSFQAVSYAARFPLVLVVNPDLPARDIREFIELARKNPGRYVFGSAGNGTGTHLAAEWLKKRADIDLLHVPYKGTGAVMPDLLAGRVHMLFDGLPPQSGHIKAARVRPLAVTTVRRAPQLPNVPALAELYPGFDMPFWTGVFAPANTPRPVVERLHAAMRKAIATSQLSQKLREFGAEGVSASTGEFDDFWNDQVALYRGVLRQTNIRLEGS